MSIIHAPDEITTKKDLADGCFYCGKRFRRLPVVHWYGPPSIYLHPRCVPRMFASLMRDVLEIEHLTRRK